jgi:hypothetical protein
MPIAHATGALRPPHFARSVSASEAQERVTRARSLLPGTVAPFDPRDKIDITLASSGESQQQDELSPVNKVARAISLAVDVLSKKTDDPKLPAPTD